MKKLNQTLLDSIVFFATPAGLIILTYGTGMIEVFGVAVHFAEMFLGRVGEFSAMFTGKSVQNNHLILVALLIGSLFAALLYFSILVMKLYSMKLMANVFSFMFGFIAFLTYAKFLMSVTNQYESYVYGVSAAFIVLVSVIASNNFTSILAEIVINSPEFKALKADIISRIGETDQPKTMFRKKRTVR